MNPKPRIVVLSLCITFMAGCATTSQEGEQQAVGVVGGAALGCLVGAIISGTQGCAYGALAGAALGWGAVALQQYQANQVSSASDVPEIYGMAPSVSSPVVKIDSGTSMPSTIKRGQQVQLLTEYALQLPQGMALAEVQESWILKKDGKVLTQVPAINVQRGAGGWEVNGYLPIPATAEPGTYVIEHEVHSGTSYDKVESVFTVEA